MTTATQRVGLTICQEQPPLSCSTRLLDIKYRSPSYRGEVIYTGFSTIFCSLRWEQYSVLVNRIMYPCLPVGFCEYYLLVPWYPWDHITGQHENTQTRTHALTRTLSKYLWKFIECFHIEAMSVNGWNNRLFRVWVTHPLMIVIISAWRQKYIHDIGQAVDLKRYCTDFCWGLKIHT